MAIPCSLFPVSYFFFFTSVFNFALLLKLSGRMTIRKGLSLEGTSRVNTPRPYNLVLGLTYSSVAIAVNYQENQRTKNR
jgi:hypothetical protein